MPATTTRMSARTAPDTSVARIVEAALACFSQVGVSKTTLEDVAAAAGISRATLYRYFPGKRAVIEGVLQHELARISAALDERLAGAADLEDLLTEALTFTGEEFHRHEALQYVLTVEPEIVLPLITFDAAGELFSTAAAVLTPHLGRFTGDPDDAARLGEWVVRVAFTYLFCPSDAVSLSDEASVRTFVRTYVVPAFDPTRR